MAIPSTRLHPDRAAPALALALLVCCALANLPLLAQSDDHWEIRFPPDKTPRSAAPLADGASLVSIAPAGDAPASATIGGMPADRITVDPISRLCVLKLPQAAARKQSRWLPSVGPNLGTLLHSISPDGRISARGAGWISSVNGKILPFALLKIDFTGEIPPVGSPILDAGGAICGLIFQETGDDRSAYAIPSQAVLRVVSDITRHGRLVRGWIGLSLDPDSPQPTVLRVLPESPASLAGILPGDNLRQIAGHPIGSYSDAANAFFYLVPGEAVRVKLLRGKTPLELSLLPSHARPD